MYNGGMIDVTRFAVSIIEDQEVKYPMIVARNEKEQQEIVEQLKWLSDLREAYYIITSLHPSPKKEGA